MFYFFFLIPFSPWEYKKRNRCSRWLGYHISKPQLYAFWFFFLFLLCPKCEIRRRFSSTIFLWSEDIFLFFVPVRDKKTAASIRSPAPKVMRAMWYELGRKCYPIIWNSGLFLSYQEPEASFFLLDLLLWFLVLERTKDCSSDGRIPYLYHTPRFSFISLNVRLTDHVPTSKVVATPWSQLLSAIEARSGIKHASVHVKFLGARYQEAPPSRLQSLCLLFGAFGLILLYCHIPLDFVKRESYRLQGCWNSWTACFWSAMRSLGLSIVVLRPLL